MTDERNDPTASTIHVINREAPELKRLCRTPAGMATAAEMQIDIMEAYQALGDVLSLIEAERVAA